MQNQSYKTLRAIKVKRKEAKRSGRKRKLKPLQSLHYIVNKGKN